MRFKGHVATLTGRKEIDMTTVKRLISATFELAFTQHREIRETWSTIAHRIGGGSLPHSMLFVSIQHIGELDILLRCMEEETKVDNSRRQQLADDVDFSFHYQDMLSEVWICNSYEVFRLLQSRKLVNQNDAFKALAHDLKLLRIPIEKHEIANDRKLSKPLKMQQLSSEGEVTGDYEYSRSDPRKAHIMGKRTSARGSVMWEALDGASGNSRWLERLSLSERIVSLWQSDLQVLGNPTDEGN